ncbi:sigma-70 family RNA polymerase sigma factor [Bacillus sp. NPDC094106]|uniref:sigma-70 family RNA polymerase sigma factor n=1 Tax=Bacillus sp. NPDC094106 TaxID=3363949 RepID=UPI0037FAE993
MTNLTEMEKEIYSRENVRLVYYVVQKFASSQIDTDELSSAGMVGYAKALKAFDKNKDVKFSTFAVRCIINEILFFLRKEKKHTINNVSLNTVLSVDKNGNGFHLEDIVVESNSDEKTLEDQVIEDSHKRMIRQAIKKLSEDEQYIMTYRYGLDNGIEKTQKQIAEDINMSQANVSKIQKQCLLKIKRLIEQEKVA